MHHRNFSSGFSHSLSELPYLFSAGGHLYLQFMVFSTVSALTGANFGLSRSA